MKKNHLTFRAVEPSTWKDFEALFESKGCPKYCWCMAWRATPEESKQTDSQSRKSFMQQRIMQNVPVGILGYIGQEPVAWCSIAPKSTYRNLTGKIKTPERDVWSLVCFFIKKEHRNRGLMRQLLQEAIRYAKDNGAKAVEAYPVDPDSPSYRFMGFAGTFEEFGFKKIGNAGSRRHIMVLKI